MSPPNNKKVVAINIHPITKGVEKIIIGGALPPPTSPAPDLEVIREYTRFVPPTTVPSARTEGIVVAPGLVPIKRPPLTHKGFSIKIFLKKNTNVTYGIHLKAKREDVIQQS